jgi:hypothetical protein
VVSRGMWVLSSFPRSERETRLPFDFAARPPHVFVPALLAHQLLEAVAQDVQTLIPAFRTFCRRRVVFELECDDDIWKTHQRRRPFYYCQGNTFVAESHAHR